MAAPHIRNRDALTGQLRAELAGPEPANRVPSERHVDWDGSLAHVKADDRGPFRQAGTGEEILTRGTPVQRYGVGVLYPLHDDDKGEIDPEDSAGADAEADAAEDRKGDRLPDDDGSAAPSPRIRAIEDDRDDFDLSNANWRRPSSMGVSLLAVLEEGGALEVDVSGGRYERRPDRGWWLRRPVRETVGCNVAALIGSGQQETPLRGHGPLQLCVQVRARPYRLQDDGRWHLLTVSLVNRTDVGAPDANGDRPASTRPARNPSSPGPRRFPCATSMPSAGARSPRSTRGRSRHDEGAPALGQAQPDDPPVRRGRPCGRS